MNQNLRSHYDISADAETRLWRQVDASTGAVSAFHYHFEDCSKLIFLDGTTAWKQRKWHNAAWLGHLRRSAIGDNREAQQQVRAVAIDGARFRSRSNWRSRCEHAVSNQFTVEREQRERIAKRTSVDSPAWSVGMRSEISSLLSTIKGEQRL